MSSNTSNSNKRAIVEDNTSSSTAPTEDSEEPLTKKFLSAHEPVYFTDIKSLSELDKRVLQKQNKNLFEALLEYKNEVGELKERIEQLEERQVKDDELMCLLNRYWNQLDEDCILILKRLDSKNNENENHTVSSSTEAFLKQLSSWDNEDIDKKLCDRVYFSKRILSKILTCFDNLFTRLMKLQYCVYTNAIHTEGSTLNGNGDNKLCSLPIDEVLRNELATVCSENGRLHETNNHMHQKLREAMIKLAEIQDGVQLSNEKTESWKAKYTEMEYKSSEYSSKMFRLDRRLAEAQTRIKSLEDELASFKGSSVIDDSSGAGGIAKSKYNELINELEDVKELAQSRLGEIEGLQKTIEEKTDENEQLKNVNREVTPETIKESITYKSILEQFNMLYGESLQMRSYLSESRQTLINNRNSHIAQLKELRANESLMMKQMQSELHLLQEANNQQRIACEKSELERKQVQIQLEHTQPLLVEMRSVIDALQAQKDQLKRENERHGKTIVRQKEEAHELQSRLSDTEKRLDDFLKNKESKGSGSSSSKKSAPSSESEIIHQLRSQLRRSQESEQEMRTMLELYKIIPSEHREKVTLLQSEQRLKQEIEVIQNELQELRRPLEDLLGSVSLKYHLTPNNDSSLPTVRGILTISRASANLSTELSIVHYCRLQREFERITKDLVQLRLESVTIENELNDTAIAFEHLQEEKFRTDKLLQEKEEAHLKLISERLKNNSLNHLLQEDRKTLEEQLVSKQAQIDTQILTIAKQEEKEKTLSLAYQALDQALHKCNTDADHCRRQVKDSKQLGEDLKMNVQKYTNQLKEAQQLVREKASVLEKESYRCNRLKEENSSLRRKYDRFKRIEHLKNPDEVLMAEVQQYKDTMTCPLCKNHKKDAILTKCFHVFCLNCLKKRYEMRNRKCPKCNATFGANDFHRIYLL